MDIQLFERYFGVKSFKISGRPYPVSIQYKDYSKLFIGNKNHMTSKIEKVINE